MKNEDKLTQLAYFSRIFLIVLQFLANQAIPDHDAKVFQYLAEKNTTKYDKIIEYLFGGFIRWDAQYFMHISKYGYTYENTLAFFPLYPVTVGLIGDFICDIIGRLYIDSVLILIYIIVNLYIFKQATLSLYKLTETVFNKKVAYDSAVLFCFNPASIFFIAPYTECLFSYLTFESILNCIKLYEKYSKPDNTFSIKDLLLILPIALSTITRSNGVLNIGFLIYTLICLKLNNPSKKKQSLCQSLYTLFRYIFAIIMTTLDCLLPFIFYQYYCYLKFCQTFPANLPKRVIEHAKKNKFVLPGTNDKHQQAWCKKILPLAYSYVQDHYWNVGFLKYYQFKQIPNFLLAMPILSVICFCSLKHLYINIVQRKLVFWFFTMENPTKIAKNKIQYDKADLYQPKLTVFYIHALFLSLFCIFFIHIQVSTRLLCSASPVFYWICSKHLNLLKLPSKSDTLKELYLRTYYVSFFIAGTLLFCNFLPWT
ncbi:phosphatidylinositol glycan anchor biosynthesis class V [Rhynchophorus ferrugineus]|uniref:phosphatidylinositol glycan anchor biosynthesis class V n=1 Tax=Rhynchophorus ferrugineus TaxID=354439 RepID=UPI003FCCD382